MVRPSRASPHTLSSLVFRGSTANEETLGSGLAASGIERSKIFVTTKFESLEPGQTAKDKLQSQLKKLKLDYVDLYLIHMPLAWKKEGELKAVWAQVEETKKAGLAKSIGVSNFKVKDLEAILADGGTVPAVNQVRQLTTTLRNMFRGRSCAAD